MTTIAQTLDNKLNHWDEGTASTVTRLVEEIIQLADADGLDLLRSRAVEQEVLDLLDEG